MPEGAEVKIIGEGLARLVSGRELLCVTPLSGRYTRKPVVGYDPTPRLWPQRVAGVGTKGKLLYWILDNGIFLLNTLGMTGGWSLGPKKHSRVRFEFDDGEAVYFNDTRNFGTLKFISGKKEFLRKLNSLGPDMLSDGVTPDTFRDRLALHPDMTLPEVLMSQGVVSGAGNYVKAEALYRAKLSPHRTVLSLRDDDYTNLCCAVQAVLEESYRAGGASIRDYLDVGGDSGAATMNFRVYGRKMDPLGNEVLRTETKDGRTTHWCPTVQK